MAVTSKQRMPSTPDVPTVREAGYPDLEMDSPGGIFGPRGMPLATRERIAEDVRAVLAADPSIAKRLEATGQVVDRAAARGVRRRHQAAARQARLDRQAARYEGDEVEHDPEKWEPIFAKSDHARNKEASKLLPFALMIGVQRVSSSWNVAVA